MAEGPENKEKQIITPFIFNFRSDVVVWKMKSPTEIEWENPKTVPSVRMDIATSLLLLIMERLTLFVTYISCQNLRENQNS